MPPAKKAASRAASTPTPPAPDPEVPQDTPDPETPTEAAEADFCPDAGVCFPYGIPAGTTAAGCIHGDWVFE